GRPPFSWSGPETLGRIVHDLAVHADGRRDHRNAAGHELNRLEAAFAARPQIVGQWIDPDVAGVEQRDLAIERPFDVLDRDSWHLDGTPGSSDPQHERVPTREL